jgi:uncharacterized membrane protein
MEDMIVLALLGLASLLVSIVVAAQLSKLKWSVEELKRRVSKLEEQRESRTAAAAAARPVIPPPLPAFLQQPPPTPAPSTPPIATTLPPAINWESILGVKLFAWIGGLALFLGVVFFVKYAFDNNLITPLMRIVAGAVIGVLLILIALIPAVRRYRVSAQSLCATGVLILYADIYAAHAFYNLIALTPASVLMWIVTAGALILAARLDAQSAAWLAGIGGFVTPALLWTRQDNPIALFGYVGVLNFGVAAVAALKRWNYLTLLAAFGSVVIEFSWTADFFGVARPEVARIIFLAIEAQFLAICIARQTTGSGENWSVAATAVTGFATLAFCVLTASAHFRYSWDYVFLMLVLGDAGLIALAMAARKVPKPEALGTIIGGALAFTWLAEWASHEQMFLAAEPVVVIAWYVALFLLFAVTPYFCGPKRSWPWFISAVAGPLQFWFVYRLVIERMADNWIGLLPLAFALPAAIGVAYLVGKERVPLASGDSRLAMQGAALLTFITLVFPVQFEREWITLGWALEGLALILLFRWIPNRRLRAVAVIILCAAFVRLALNPAVLHYHPRSQVPIFNWYLYVYGAAAFCFGLSARFFGEPREKNYERNAPALLYLLVGITLFLLMNIEIADYFSIGPTLTFSFSGNFARDMTYTIAWAVFAFALLVIGISFKASAARFAAIGLLCLTLAKLFLHDLDSLNQLYRIAAFITVAIIAIVASFAYQRFLSPSTKKS